MKRLIALLAALLLLASGAHAADGAGTLMQVDRDFSAATAKGGSKAWASFFAANGSQIGPDGYVIGPEAIAKHMAFLDDPNVSLTWTPTRADISGGGNVGYTWGRWVRRVKKDDQIQVSEGNYVTVWERQKDGSWKVLFDTGEPDGPARTSTMKE